MVVDYGIFAEFNGSLYVSMVTGKTDATTGVTNKQGFAVYRGDPQKDGSWKWTPIIGDTSKGLNMNLV